MHIIKTTAPIPTRFCTVIKTTKCPSCVVQTHAQQIQDGGRPPYWKNRKIVISPPRFDRFRPNLARRRSSTLLSRSIVKKFKLQKSKMAAAAILKIEKLPYLGRGLTDFNQIWHGNAVRLSWGFRPLKISTFKNPRWRRPPSWKTENHHMSATVGSIVTKFGTLTQFDPFDHSVSKIGASSLTSTSTISDLRAPKS